MFLPSDELLEAVFAASPTFTAEVQARAAFADQQGLTFPRWQEQARQTLGEQITGEIGMARRQQAVPTPKTILLATTAGYLAPPFEQHLLRYLHMRAQQPRYAVVQRLLARDLFAWVGQGGPVTEDLGLSADPAGGRVLLQCQTLVPVLPPLGDEG